jgi:ribonuclease P protein component
MLDKKHRLPARVSFKNAESFSSGLLVIKTKNNKTGFPRFGIVISKKTEKKAVERNRVKRQIRKSVEELIPKINSGKDFLIIVKRGLAQKSTGEILSLLKGLLKKEKNI